MSIPTPAGRIPVAAISQATAPHIGLDDPSACPNCGSEMMGVEYRHDHPDHYDGVSEWSCSEPRCQIRVGRWTGRILVADETEPRYGRGTA